MFKKSRYRPLSEAVAYSRCYGARSGHLVDVIKAEPHVPLRKVSLIAPERPDLATRAKLLRRAV